MVLGEGRKPTGDRSELKGIFKLQLVDQGQTNTSKRVFIVVPTIFVQGMLWGVKLGMLWGTPKRTFCHRSSPNRSYSKKEVYHASNMTWRA
jgi:hypothetical protein